MHLNSWQDRWFVVLNNGFAACLFIVVLYPIVYIISASVSSSTAVNSGEMWLWPVDFSWEGYRRVLQNQDIWTGYRNTLFYAVVGTAINLTLTIPCAYALSRKDFSGRNSIMLFIVFTMFFSGGLIPSYLLIRDLGMLNTVWALMIPKAVAVFNIIVTRTFFQSTIPRELEEASEIDGCSNFRLFVWIVLPLSAPIIAVMALFYGVMHWNSFFDALIYLQNRQLYPLQLILREILVLNEVSDEMMFGTAEDHAAQARIADVIKYAVIIVSTLPIIFVYPLLQRYFVKGVMIGSLKG